jgi:hypothetical protein
MKPSFFVKTIIIGLCLWIIGCFVSSFKEASTSTLWIITIAVYASITNLFKKWVDATKDKSAIRFTTVVNGITAVKMLLTLSIITVYLATGQQNQVQYVFGVFIIFICYTALLVFEAQSEIKKG